MHNHEQQTALTPWKWVPADQPLVHKPVVVVTPKRPEGPRWILAGFLIALLGVAGPLGWLLWSWKQEESAARQQALLQQRERELQWQAGQRQQIEAMQDLMRQIEAVSPTVATQPVPAIPVPASPLAIPLPAAPARPVDISPPVEALATVSLSAEPSHASLIPDQPPLPKAQPERVKLELKSASEPSAGEAESKPKRGLVKFLTSSIFVDSAVLTTSLLVPPSIPLTLAQSRLGRRLTGRIFRKTKTEKTLAAKVVRDVEDMPITQRRRR